MVRPRAVVRKFFLVLPPTDDMPLAGKDLHGYHRSRDVVGYDAPVISNKLVSRLEPKELTGPSSGNSCEVQESGVLPLRYGVLKQRTLSVNLKGCHYDKYNLLRLFASHSAAMDRPAFLQALDIVQYRRLRIPCQDEVCKDRANM